MFRAFYTPIIRSTISTVSTASGTNHSIVSATFFQRGLIPGIKRTEKLSRYSDWDAGWTVRGSNPGGGEIFRTSPDRPWGPSSLLYNGYPVSSEGKERPGRDADPLWSCKGRAIPLLPLQVVWLVQSLSACTRAHFTTFYQFLSNSFQKSLNLYHSRLYDS